MNIVIIELECFESAKDIFMRVLHERSEKKGENVMAE